MIPPQHIDPGIIATDSAVLDVSAAARVLLDAFSYTVAEPVEWVRWATQTGVLATYAMQILG